MIKVRESEKITRMVLIFNMLLSCLGFILTILFIVAELLNWINWSWWWILVPILLPSFYSYSIKSSKEEDE